MMFQASDRIYVDESKARGYYVVATATAVSSVHESEKALRSLLKPGQRRIHFKSERDSRRRLILSRMCELDVRVAVWIAKGRADKEARPLCLAPLAEEAARARATHLFIERDDSVMHADRKLIAEALRREESTTLQYLHVSLHECPLLWVSDAVAWCCSNGGDWLRRITPLVETRILRV